jgi:nicotinamidase-related amidase
MLDLKGCVLLPIDMQAAFDEPNWPPRWNNDVDQNGLALIAAWRRVGLPIIHIRHDSVSPGSSLRPGTAGNSFRPGFGPIGDEGLVAKSVNSAFIGTDLDLRLRRLGAKSILAFGITTDQCVSTTIRVGSNMGWRMLLATDASDCTALPDGAGGHIPAKTVHDIHVATLRAEFCEVVTTAKVLQALKEGQHHELS